MHQLFKKHGHESTNENIAVLKCVNKNSENRFLKSHLDNYSALLYGTERVHTCAAVENAHKYNSSE